MDIVSTVDDPDEATLQVLQNIKAFQEFLDSDAVSPADATTVLRALSKVTKSEFHEESVLKILQTVCASRFLDSHLPSLINHLSISGVDQGIRPVEVVEMIHQLVSSITRRLPSFASKGSLLLSYISQAHKVMSTLRSWKPGLEDSLMELKEECERCTKMVQSASQQKQQAKVKQRPNQDDETPPESYIFLPILPSWHDMDWTEKPFLR
nr:hypothetical protein BaRGS_011955 [Batillaria attramentaria]